MVIKVIYLKHINKNFKVQFKKLFKILKTKKKREKNNSSKLHN